MSPIVAVIGLAVLVFASLLAIGWPVLSTPSAPSGDFAADMLLANQIREQGWLWVGHYSRWEFNHPGPFWLYFNHLFEVLASPLPLERMHAWMLGSIMFNALLVMFAVNALSIFFYGRFRFLYAAAGAAVLVGLLGETLISIWMPDRIVMPYVAFLVALLHVARGKLGYLAVSVFLASVLIHGYATMPLFTLPFLGMAVLVGVAWSREDTVDLRLVQGQLLLSLMVALVFAVPLLIDATAGSDSNIARLFAAQATFTDMPRPTWREMFTVVGTLVFGGNVVGWTMAGGMFMLAWQRAHVGKGVRTSIVFTFILCLLIVLATVLYYKNTPAPVYPFVAKFLSGVPGLLAAALVALFFFPWRASNDWWFHNIEAQRFGQAGAVVVLILLLGHDIELPGVPDDGSLIRELADAVEEQVPESVVAVDYTRLEQWHSVAGLLLELDDRGKDACTIWAHMAYLYTESRICGDDVVPDVRVIEAAACGDRCEFVSGNLGLERFRLGAIVAGEWLAYDSDKLIFRNWWGLDDGFRWSAGHKSTIVLEMSNVGALTGRLTLELGALGTQRVTIRLNGKRVFSGELEGWDETLLVSFPPDRLRVGRNTIAFELPDADHPGNGDPRKLGLAFRSIVVR